MHLEFTGRHFAVTPKLKAKATGYLEGIYPILQGATRAHFIFTEDKYRRIVEIEVYCRGENLVATCEGTDMEQVLHDSVRRIEQQAVRLKERDRTIRDHPKPMVDPDGDVRGVTDSLSTQQPS